MCRNVHGVLLLPHISCEPIISLIIIVKKKGETSFDSWRHYFEFHKIRPYLNLDDIFKLCYHITFQIPEVSKSIFSPIAQIRVSNVLLLLTVGNQKLYFG